MKYLFLLNAFVFASLLVWCTIQNNWLYSTGEKNIYTWNSNASSWSENEIINWTIASWIFISWQQLNIYNFWNIIIYGWLFTLSTPKEIDKREYYNMYDETLSLDDNIGNVGLSISSYISTWLQDELSNKDKCAYDYTEWVLSKSIFTKEIDWKIVYLANILFSISSPDTLPRKSWQSCLCFVNNDVVYRISVSDNLKYREDIINSFKFIKQ